MLESTSTTTRPDEIAIVVPAYNAAELLPRTLPALRAMAANETLLVVDAGSTDRTSEVAREFGARVHRLPVRAGPAEARNAGVEAVASEVVLFIDADCVPHPDVLARVREAFRTSPDLVALTGSYDATPPDPGFFSQYMNLRHHDTHQRARREPSTFWSGCGAVRRKAFLEVGGFDAVRFPRPQVEDIELGARLRRLGRMRLDPDLQVTHLKRWTLTSVIDTDIRCRAIPWGRMILESGQAPDDLNLRLSQRVAAGLAPLALLAALTAPIALVTAQWLLLLSSALVLGAAAALNAGLLGCFARCRGWAFALGAGLFHQVHLTYSATTFAVLALQRWLAPRLRS